MAAVFLGLAVVAGLVVLNPVSDRLRTPLPVLLTVFGLALALVPGSSELKVSPELILPAVLPPLLFAATQRSTAQEFRSQARPILVLAVGLTLASAGLVAVLAHLSGLSWGVAWVLGAVVAPPDPVAATAVARRLRLPQGLVTVLEGEGMFNDATALVLYGVAVEAVREGRLSTADVTVRLVLGIAGGLVVGLVAGLLTRAALGRLSDAMSETTVTLAAPFVAYVTAEAAHGSGVLAVLSMGLFLRSYGHRALTSGGWLLGRSVWRYVDHLITSVVFVLIGYELTAVLKTRLPSAETMWLAARVIGALVVLRLAWILSASWLEGLARQRQAPGLLHRRGEALIAGWAGMRGVVTVATALAVPLSTRTGASFPGRDAVTVVGLACVAVTLVVQGLTLAPLIQRMGVASEANVSVEAVELRRAAAGAGRDVVARAGGEIASDDAVRVALLLYEQERQRQLALEPFDTPGGQPAEGGGLAELLGRATAAERGVVLQARRHGRVGSEAADEVLDEIESRAITWIGR